MAAPEMEFIGNKALIKTDTRLCDTPEEAVRSDLFAKILDSYIDKLSEHHSSLLNIFGEEDKNFLERIKTFFSGEGGEGCFIEKREITGKQRATLISALAYLCKITSDELPKIVEGTEIMMKDTVLFTAFLDGLYEHWRKFDRFLFIKNEQGGIKPRAVIKEHVEKLTVIIRNAYRNIKENLSAAPPRIFRQVRTGAEITALTEKHPDFPLAGIYSKLREVPVIRNIVITPPIILNPSMNKRKGSFSRAEKNPAESVVIEPDDWICYPAKVGEVLVYVYIRKHFIDLGLSLCNLFELADDRELGRRPDAVYFYGAQEGITAGPDGSKTVFYEDEENKVLTACVPGGDEYGYFGYLKKMMLTLHNIVMMKRKRLPFHGAFVRVVLKGGRSANVLMIGDTGAGKSETIEAFRAIGDEYIQDLTVVADDMGSLELGKDGNVTAYGTEIGAFLRMDDLRPGYAFGELDAAIIMSASQANARIIIPITPFETVIKGHGVDYVLYANNYDESGGAIEKFGSAKEALDVFKEGKVMSKGTTDTTGIVNSYFANIFGPPQYRELHDKIAADFFDVFFEAGVYVGQVRTRLGIKGFERKGPEESAKALLETILKS